MGGLIDRLTCPRSSTMSCRTKVQTQIFPFHSIAAETKRLLFNSNDIATVLFKRISGSGGEREHASKTQKLMSPRNLVFLYALQLWKKIMLYLLCSRLGASVFPYTCVLAIQHVFGT